MSLDARFIPARAVDAKRIESYPYPVAQVLPHVESILPTAESEEPLGTDYKESPEEAQQRLANVQYLEKTTEETVKEKLAQAEKLAAAKISEAETYATAKKADAEQKAAEALQRAFEKGYEEGYTSGEREGRIYGEGQYKIHMARLEEKLATLSDAASLIKAASEDEALALITVMAEYLAGQRLGSTMDTATPLLHSLFDAHPFPLPESAGPNDPAAVISMNPRDFELAKELIPHEYPGVRLSQDPELSRGSLTIETAGTIIESTFEKRRERLSTLIKKLMEEGQL